MSEIIVDRLNATDKWWMIGKGRSSPAEPLFGCLIQEPSIDGAVLAKAEGNDIASCVEMALIMLKPEN